MTFKDIKETSWERCYEKISLMIRKLYNEHGPALSECVLSDLDREIITRILEGKANQAEYEEGLRHLSHIMHTCAGQPAVILIDEYDTPLHAGYLNGYYEQIIGFMRNFLSGGLKDNPHLFKGVLTGILRVAKESVFSGLNNLSVYTVLRSEFSEFFGFTDAEVRQILSDYDIADHYDEVRQWYDGCLFGGITVYNPWSLISYVNSRGRKPLPYWLNTGDTSLMDRLATKGGRELREEIGRLLEGETVERPIYESIVMRDLDLRDDLLWSFLLFSGYLKPVRQVDDEKWELDIPKREVFLS